MTKANRGGPRILVVDDESKIRDLVEVVLEDEGFDVVPVGGVDAALDRLDAKDIDLVLTDLRMPGRDGLDLVRQMREHHPTVPSIILTGHASTDTAIEALRLGVTDYLRKPFGIDELKDTVTRTLAERAKLRAEREWTDELDRVSSSAAGFERAGSSGRTRDESAASVVPSSPAAAVHLPPRPSPPPAGPSARPPAATARTAAPRSVERRAEALAFVDRIQTSAATAYALDRFLGEGLEQVGSVLQARRGSVLLTDTESDPPELVVRALRGHPRPDEARRRRLRFGEGVAGWVAASGSSLRVDDVTHEPRFAWTRREEYATGSLLCIPLHAPTRGTRVVGVLCLSDREDGQAFDAEDEELSRTLGTALASAIEHHRAVQNTRAQQLATTRALVEGLEAKDPFIRGHAERVTRYSLRIARTMGLPEEDRRVLYYGATLHDIGKLGVPERILQKPGSLTDDEFRVIALHPEIGARLVRRLHFLDEVQPIIRHHHERWDGRGYPDGLAGESIPRLASVVSVADAFDAMTSGRTYRDALEFPVARAEIERHTATQFRPEVVEAFLAIPDFEEPGRRSFVETSLEEEP